MNLRLSMMQATKIETMIALVTKGRIPRSFDSSQKEDHIAMGDLEALSLKMIADAIDTTGTTIEPSGASCRLPPRRRMTSRLSTMIHLYQIQTSI
jgi:hypothetical protein